MSEQQLALQNPSAINPEKLKLYQQQLILLLHGQKCQDLEKECQENGENFECTVLHCSIIKAILNHMRTCQNGITCPFDNCSASRTISSHWEHCIRVDCIVCAPLRKDLDIHEQCKVFQRHLVILLHAVECQNRESEGNDQVVQCNLPQCKATKDAINHLKACGFIEKCKFPNCFFSRQLISHWKNCNNDSCPVCLPSREVNKNTNSFNGILNLPMAAESKDAELSDMVKAYNALNISN